MTPNRYPTYGAHVPEEARAEAARKKDGPPLSRACRRANWNTVEKCPASGTGQVLHQLTSGNPRAGNSILKGGPGSIVLHAEIARKRQAAAGAP